MSTFTHEGTEYARAGDVWVRRDAETTDAWEECPLDDVPDAVGDAATALYERKRAGEKGGIPRGPFAKITKADEVE